MPPLLDSACYTKAGNAESKTLPEWLLVFVSKYKDETKTMLEKRDAADAIILAAFEEPRCDPKMFVQFGEVINAGGRTFLYRRKDRAYLRRLFATACRERGKQLPFIGPKCLDAFAPIALDEDRIKALFDAIANSKGKPTEKQCKLAALKYPKRYAAKAKVNPIPLNVSPDVHASFEAARKARNLTDSKMLAELLKTWKEAQNINGVVIREKITTPLAPGESTGVDSRPVHRKDEAAILRTDFSTWPAIQDAPPHFDSAPEPFREDDLADEDADEEPEPIAAIVPEEVKTPPAQVETFALTAETQLQPGDVFYQESIPTTRRAFLAYIGTDCIKHRWQDTCKGGTAPLATLLITPHIVERRASV